jgi:hypothetical protein
MPINAFLRPLSILENGDGKDVGDTFTQAPGSTGVAEIVFASDDTVEE